MGMPPPATWAGAEGARARVAEALAHAAHLLPDQAPVRVFIHHNTLHAFQHLPFHEAVRRGQELYGAEPYPLEARFRAELHAGRITDDDLGAALRERFPGRDHELVPGRLTRMELFRLLLRHGLRDENVASLAWLAAERDGLTRFREDLPEAVRVRLLSEGTRHLREVLASDGGALALGRLLTATRLPDEIPAAVAAELDLRCEREPLERALAKTPERLCAKALFEACLTRLSMAHPSLRPRAPRVELPRDTLRALTGDDPYDQLFPALIRVCSAYLDQGVASWVLPAREVGFYASVRALVAAGTAGPGRFPRLVREDFRRQLERERSAMDVVCEVLSELGVDDESIAPFVEKLLLTLPGWAGLVSRLERHPDERTEATEQVSLLDFLAVRLTYERAALLAVAQHHRGDDVALGELLREVRIRPASGEHPRELAHRMFQAMQLAGVSTELVLALPREDLAAILEALGTFDELMRREVFLEAYERHYRLRTLAALARHREGRTLEAPVRAPALQLVCCFDEREESFRRHMEAATDDVQTFGAPGFFGAAMRFRALGARAHVPLAPVVIDPEHEVSERPRLSDYPVHETRERRRALWARVTEQLHRGSRSLWRGMLLNVALGLLALFPLLVRIVSPRLTGRVRTFVREWLLPAPRTLLEIEHQEGTSARGRQRGFTVDERVTRVQTVLENVGLVRSFAQIVVVLGHGSTTLNNPHRSAYDCGACGGRQGGPNARAFCLMANDPEVRRELAQRGIVIARDTWFVAGQHDTCSDAVTLFDTDRMPETHTEPMRMLRETLDRARAENARERCRRLFSAPNRPSARRALAHVEGRAEHLAEPRPEFGHATNAVAIVGRRSLTRGLFLDRRAFLISYDPVGDDDGGILARILGAAVPVGAGISLEYYFSHVDNERLGAGSKLPHNVTGLVGVMTGHASDLRTGLPRQMIEIHEPMRLLMIVEASPERLLSIAAQNRELELLITLRWVQLVALDPSSGAMHVFGPTGFSPFTPPELALPEVSRWEQFYEGKRGPLGPARLGGRAA